MAKVEVGGRARASTLVLKDGSRHGAGRLVVLGNFQVSHRYFDEHSKHDAESRSTLVNNLESASFAQARGDVDPMS